MIASAQQDFLDLFDRLLPLAYLSPLKNPGPGYEVLQAYAKLYARASVAVKNFDLQAFILTATSGSNATGFAQLFRASAAAGAVTVRAGTLLRASKSGRRYVVTQDVAFTAVGWGTDTSIVVPIAAEGAGYEYNVAGAASLPVGNLSIAKAPGATSFPAEGANAINRAPNPSFENLISTTQATSWGDYNNSPGLEPTTLSIVAGRSGNRAQRVAWAVNNSSNKGVTLLVSNNATDFIGGGYLPFHTYLITWWAYATGTNVGNPFASMGFNQPPQTDVALANPNLSGSFQRYARLITWGALVPGGVGAAPSNKGELFINYTAATNGSLNFDDVQIIDVTEILTAFPASGKIVIDKALATEETLAYTSILNGAFQTGAAAQAHAIGATVQLAPPKAADGRTVLGADIDTLDTLVTDPSYGDQTIVLDPDCGTGCTGGLPPLLDALGGDVGLVRSQGETDPQFRQRIRNLPDSVSPGALRRAIVTAFAQFAGTPMFVETFQQSYQTAFDFPMLLGLWHCDEASGANLIDALGRYTLAAGGSPLPAGVTGKLAGARQVGVTARNGFSSVGSTPIYNAINSGNWTAELLFQIDASMIAAGQSPYDNNSGTIFGVSSPPNLLVGFASSKRIRYYNGGQNFLAYDWTQLGSTWHQLSVRSTAVPATAGSMPTTATVDFFVDGLLIGTLSGMTVPVGVASGSISVGGEGANFDNFVGLVDEVRFWSAPLSNADIARSWANVQAGRPAAQTLVNSHTCVFDDPGSTTPMPGGTTRLAQGFFNRWLDAQDRAGAFICVAPVIPAILDVGMAYDDPSTLSVGGGPSQFTTAAGRRGCSAYDVTSQAPAAVLDAGYDGFDLQRAGVYLNVFKMLQSIKAAGVAAVLELAGQ